MVEIQWEEFGLVRTIAGRVTESEMDSSAQEIQGNPRLDEMRYNIHDFTAAKDILLSEDDIEFLAVRASISVQRNPVLKIAFIGTHPMVYKLMDAFNSSECCRNRVHRFDTMAEARQYIAGHPAAS